MGLGATVPEDMHVGVVGMAASLDLDPRASGAIASLSLGFGGKLIADALPPRVLLELGGLLIALGAVPMGCAVAAFGASVGIGTSLARRAGFSKTLSLDICAVRLDTGVKMFGRRVVGPELKPKTVNFNQGRELSAAVRACLRFAKRSLFVVISTKCEGFSKSSEPNNGVALPLCQGVYDTPTIVKNIIKRDKEKKLKGGLIENVVELYTEGTNFPWELLTKTLMDAEFHVLAFKPFKMTSVRVPSDRDRAIVLFWRANPGVKPGLLYA